MHGFAKALALHPSQIYERLVMLMAQGLKDFEKTGKVLPA